MPQLRPSPRAHGEKPCCVVSPCPVPPCSRAEPPCSAPACPLAHTTGWLGLGLRFHLGKGRLQKSIQEWMGNRRVPDLVRVDSGWSQWPWAVLVFEENMATIW
uniref:Uncharacterized protein n=1 Tax=Arundo donax TaxID=35708 RepID=A0A0A9C8N6_ARUDO